ncbi:MAG: hypothetical protein ACK5RI_05975, partial [Bacteroidota bacterium]
MNAKKNSYAYVVSDCLSIVVAIVSIYLLRQWFNVPVLRPDLSLLYVICWLIWFAFTGAYYQPLAEKSRLNEWSISVINTLAACGLLHLFFPHWFPTWSNWCLFWLIHLFWI